ncbi:50S ribosomal protein L2 [Methanocella sp. CWC-04]|uniref:Large ribosomal subunit protein uL2 n=1 Tax=Methanooceanicella nereidis TaxID=2052831 RepID=A0AAP2RAV7_9EURY|nr:50S ribosomal protein L2 [Methanocella sp. CWC-04]MCD1293511.1 50S ribosomal protein L2 [Methanocella sp. CWC-04]
MGKRLMSQNRGKGTPTYRATSSRFKADLQHIKTYGDETIEGVITEVLHDPARNAPIVRVKFGNGEEKLILAPEGLGLGDTIKYGVSAEIKVGNTLPLSEIPEGCPICNIESQPGDGGSFARSTGVYAILVAHEANRSVVQLPSGEMKWLNPKCRATIGVVAGGGRLEKPFVKAGNKFYKMQNKAGKWPVVRGVAMNAVDHPFGGGGRQHPGRPKTVGRHTSPGRKVGSIAARRTGIGH